MSDLVVVANQAKAEAECRESTGTNGQGDLMRELSQNPVAKDELRAGMYRGYDHVHLARIDGTNYVQWHGRSASGYHHPLGRIMEITEPPKERSHEL